MLEEISIFNFAIIDQQTVPFSYGFNVMSGETGAGKSILIDALGLQLGDRADTGWIRHNTTRCDIQSSYRFPPGGSIEHWLTNNEFDQEEGCQLRRTISNQGKSKCYINGIPTTVGNTKSLGEMLVDIHGQHAHQSLIKTDKQLELLDDFADHKKLQTEVRASFQAWKALLKKQEKLSSEDNNIQDKCDLLRYQLQELETLQLTEGEFSQLSEEQKRLTYSSDIFQEINQIDQLIDGDTSISTAFNQVITATENIIALDETAASISELFNQALIYIDEGRSALNQYAQSVELDPERLSEVEQRMGLLHDLSRKHRVNPDDLWNLQDDLQQKLNALEQALEELKKIDIAIGEAQSIYQDKALKLSSSRKKWAKKLSKAVDQKLAMLSLSHAQFSIQFKENLQPKASGIDDILFLFAPNPGQSEKPLHKIASGGELSRISLAIQVAGIAKKSETTLIFDEVDSGIGGATAEVVGRLLKTLSQYNQVICVTHLAQVASFADQHIKISKSVKDDETFTQFSLLDETQRIEELARMSGGIHLDKKTLEHAKELRDNALAFEQKIKTQ